jgi:hypothetical protein
MISGTVLYTRAKYTADESVLATVRGSLPERSVFGPEEQDLLYGVEDVISETAQWISADVRYGMHRLVNFGNRDVFYVAILSDPVVREIARFKALRQLEFKDIFMRSRSGSLSNSEAAAILGTTEQIFIRWLDNYEDWRHRRRDSMGTDAVDVLGLAGNLAVWLQSPERRRNEQTWLYSGYGAEPSLANALENLQENYAFVAVTDRLGDCLPVLCNRFALTPVEAAASPIAPQTKEEYQSVYNVLRDTDPDDLELYRQASLLVEQRLSVAEEQPATARQGTEFSPNSELINATVFPEDNQEKYVDLRDIADQVRRMETGIRTDLSDLRHSLTRLAGDHKANDPSFENQD